MGDILVVKTSTGKKMTNFRLDDDYVGAATIAADLVGAHYPAESLDSYALCDAVLWESYYTPEGATEVAEGFDIMAKSAVTTETIIAPDGVALQDIDAGDSVVCTTNTQT